MACATVHTLYKRHPTCPVTWSGVYYTLADPLYTQLTEEPQGK